MAAAGSDSDSDSDYGWDLSFEEHVNQLLSVADPAEVSADRGPRLAEISANSVPLRGGAPTHTLSPKHIKADPDGDEAHSQSLVAGAATAKKGSTPSSAVTPKEPDTGQVGDVIYPDLGQAFADLSSDLSGTDQNRSSKKGKKAVKSKKEDNANLSPLERFRTYPRKPLSVSDLISGAWCELQYEYTLTRLPGGKRTRTPAMKGGTKVHERLEEEVHTTVQVEIVSREDMHGLKLWNMIQGLRTLRMTGLTRELEIWGVVEGNVVSGVIDALSYHNPDPDFETKANRAAKDSKDGLLPNTVRITEFFASQKAGHSGQSNEDGQPCRDRLQESQQRKIYITDIKTRGSNTLPTGAAVRPAKIQLFLYHRFLSDLATGHLDFQLIFDRYGLDPDAPFSDAFIAQIGSMHDEIFYDDDTSTEPTSTAQSTDNTSKGPSEKDNREHSDESDESYQPESDDHPDSMEPAMIRYRNLRSLAELLQTEASLTFPNGASSLGDLVAVEYRLRARRQQPRRTKRRGGALAVSNNDNDGGASSDNSEFIDLDADEDAGRCIGTNVIPVDSTILDRYLEKYLAWWRGERAATGVEIEEASLKCGFCEFAADCDWRQTLDEERVRRVREKLAARSAG